MCVCVSPYLPPESWAQRAGEFQWKKKVNIDQRQPVSLFFCLGGTQECGEITPRGSSCWRELPAANHTQERRGEEWEGPFYDSPPLEQKWMDTDW